MPSGPQSIVSCNQLVRQLAPLLVDATAASLQPGSTAERQAAIQQMLQHRLATDAAAALGQKGPERAAAAAAAASAPAQGCAIDRHPGAASEQTPPLIDAPLFIGRVPAGALVRLAWDAGRLQGDGGHGLLLLVHAAPPCSQWSLVTTPLEGPSRQLAPAAAALPPLLPRLQQRWVPRHWEDLVGGIDWQQNATRLLYLPFQGPAGEQLDTISTGVVGGASGDTLLLAQVLPSDPLRHPLQLKKPGGSCCSKAALLPDGHPAVRALQLPRDAWPLGGCPGGARSLLNRDCLLAVLLGTTPPWNLHIQARACDTARGHPDGLLPAVVGMAAGAAPAVSVRVATPAEPSSAGSSSGVVQLWDGMQGVESGRLLLVSDPGCSYSLR